MAILKIRDENGNIIEIPAIQGPPGKDGVVEYIDIEDASYTILREKLDAGSNVVLRSKVGNDVQYYFPTIKTEHNVAFCNVYGDYMYTKDFTDSGDVYEFDRCVAVLQDYDPTSGYAQSGTAVAYAISQSIGKMSTPIKEKVIDIGEQMNTTSCNVRVVDDETHYYEILSVTTFDRNTLEQFLCDVSIYDYQASGGFGCGDITISFSEPLECYIVVKIVYKEWS